MDDQDVSVVKRRSRVLRRRTRQDALDKPRVHDGQLGFAIREQKACVTAAKGSLCVLIVSYAGTCANCVMCRHIFF